MLAVQSELPKQSNEGVKKKAVSEGGSIYLCETKEVKTTSIRMQHKTRGLFTTLLSNFSMQDTKYLFRVISYRLIDIIRDFGGSREEMTKELEKKLRKIAEHVRKPRIFVY
eukprot:TRINITY_DN7156_c0_g1_i2.p4 TRINITY_DN7156_c0_g1~~TRINITY_DN7156_c0_g1_i2.p4  ORF type:complete len:111 (+),score=10.86 TRINITY_DN7156_c0_g1_i2:695-1027(+)